MSERVFIVIPVHNRCAITLACLRTLRAQGVLAWAWPLVVDDGSNDGTGEAVRAEFPEAVVLRGAGELWWTGATALGMREARRRQADYIFWLNDDFRAAPGAFEILLQVARTRGAVAGAVGLLPRTQQPFYGGFRRTALDLARVACAPDEAVRCDALNGNLVCLPRAVVDAIGYPDGHGLPHAHGDTDYTLRASAHGFAVLLVGAARGLTHPNAAANHRSWLLGDISLGEMWCALGQKRSYAYFPAHFRFMARHWGSLGVLRCLWLVAKRGPITLVRLLVPQTVLRRVWGHRSRAWQQEQQLMAELADKHD